MCVLAQDLAKAGNPNWAGPLTASSYQGVIKQPPTSRPQASNCLPTQSPPLKQREHEVKNPTKQTENFIYKQEK